MNRLLHSLFAIRRNSICQLERLPNELLLQIADHLAPNLRDLNALLRADRLLHHLLTPQLHIWALGAVADRYGRTILRNAAARGNIALLAKLLSPEQGVGVDDAEPVSGTTTLDGAIMLDRADAVAVLLRNGACVELADQDGWTPLHFAALSGNCEIASQLLHRASNRVRRGQSCNSGATPLHFAAAMGNNQIVELLLKNGANLAVVDRYGMKPVEHAVMCGWPKTVELVGGYCGGMRPSSLAELQQSTVVFRWHALVRKEGLWAGVDIR